jgi:hypothetical protein
MTDAEKGYPPPWATGQVADYMEVGAELCTRDGRCIGNAVVVAIKTFSDNTLGARVRTDFGNEVVLIREELKNYFHPPQWRMDPAEHAETRARFAREQSESSG